VSINIASLIKLAEFFLRTPKEQAELDFADKSQALIARIVTLDEFAAWETSGEALIRAEGWGVAKDAATGHVIAVTPPPFVAPAHQSPTDFNLHQGDGA
jgi:hypothetical protein